MVNNLLMQIWHVFVFTAHIFTRHNYTGGFRFCMEQRVDFQRIDWIKLQYNVTWCCDRFS